MDRYMISIPAAGPCKLVACDDGDSVKLETMQQLIDGPIEVTPSSLGITWAREPVDGISVIVNDEGQLRGLPDNDRASCLWKYEYLGTPLVGDALLCATRGEDLIGFTKPVCKTLAEFWNLQMEDDTWSD